MQKRSGTLIDRLCVLARMTLVPLLARELLQRRRVTILLYHRPSPETLREHLRVLGKTYNLVSLPAVATALEQDAVRCLPPKPLVITFDDGHRSNAALIGVFRELPAPPTVFLCSGLVDTALPFWFDVVADPEALKRLADVERLRVLDGHVRPRPGAERAALAREEIEALKPYVHFQSHTVSHPILPRCGDAKARRELTDSRAQLEQRYGLHVDALAYPNGDYSQRELRLARAAGYRCAVTVDFGFNGPATDPLRLRRIAIDDDEDGAGVVALKACGVWGALRAVRSALTRRGRARGLG
ncbi:MAG TPA: polysaccharide deacetylase family protein [Baekduia sp.]|nr:polysaccharide deacetylase family protein [Baekduia sp.]